MTSINEKMGFKRPGKRAFMNLPKTRSEAVKITAAKCPQCGLTGARASRTQPGKLYFPCCNTFGDVPTASA